MLIVHYIARVFISRSQRRATGCTRTHKASTTRCDTRFEGVHCRFDCSLLLRCRRLTWTVCSMTVSTTAAACRGADGHCVSPDVAEPHWHGALRRADANRQPFSGALNVLCEPVGVTTLGSITSHMPCGCVKHDQHRMLLCNVCCCQVAPIPPKTPADGIFAQGTIVANYTEVHKTAHMSPRLSLHTCQVAAAETPQLRCCRRSL